VDLVLLLALYAWDMAIAEQPETGDFSCSNG